MKRLLAVFVSAAMMLSLAACGSSASPAASSSAAPSASAPASSAAATESKPEASGAGKKIGVAMPTQSSQRWIQDGGNMKEKLEELGYEVDLQYAEDDVQMQVSQLENMITNGASCLVVASIDSSALVNVLAQAKAAGIPVVAYDRLLMDTDAVDYYATFDNKGVGTAIGQYIEEKMGLKEGKGPYNIEFFAGSPDDNNAHMLNAGMFEVLQPYLDSGKLVCVSGQTDFDTICTLRWSQETAQQRMENLLSANYSTGKDVDIVVSPFDGISYGIAAALEGAGYKVGEKWPLITGQDAELMAAKNILSGKQSQTIFKDTRVLAEKCVTMVQAVLEGSQPEINDTETYNNNVKVVPSYLCTPVSVDKDNLTEMLVDTGYYTADQLKG
ncbi:multiple monosaccharide ABC transporter substrate-binding protein [Marasmitruncus massiliensis]|uniref:multiple monosaccharide ABC transporter substrate-binding protein n=1 Tax=Marasmitruncus massiliensis TaxID=1944642 RepID=UPI000C7D5135|nr:multiple monosaccharide ABC transporter substrate-binding protein [Marasmitruncus massiliensis]